MTLVTKLLPQESKNPAQRMVGSFCPGILICLKNLMPSGGYACSSVGYGGSWALLP